MAVFIHLFFSRGKSSSFPLSSTFTWWFWFGCKGCSNNKSMKRCCGYKWGCLRLKGCCSLLIVLFLFFWNQTQTCRCFNALLNSLDNCILIFSEIKNPHVQNKLNFNKRRCGKVIQSHWCLLLQGHTLIQHALWVYYYYCQIAKPTVPWSAFLLNSSLKHSFVPFYLQWVHILLEA